MPAIESAGRARTSRRLHGLDALRATALLLGVVLHALMAFVPGMPWMVVDQDPRPYAFPVIAIIHLFRMTVFLVLAGFFAQVVVRKRGMRRFLRERTVRIALPVVVLWPFVVMPLGLISAAWHFAHGKALPVQEGTFSIGHLWFLWVLFECCLLLACVRWVGQRLAPEWTARLADRLSALVTGPWAVPALAISYFVTQMWQGDTYAGITEPTTFVPEMSGLLAYLTAFVAGWGIARVPGAIVEVARPWKRHLVVALLTSPFVLLLSGLLSLDPPGGGWNVVLSATSAVCAWAWTYGLLGVSVLHLQEERPWVRYLADASYWIYLVHLPIVVGIGGLLTHAPLPAEAKLVVILGGAMVILLLTYDLFVRSTWIGAWLNGSRRSRALLRSWERSVE